MKFFFIWLFFCTSSTQNTFFFGFFPYVLVAPCLDSDVVAALVPNLFATSMESSTLLVSSTVPLGEVTPEPGAFPLATIRSAALPAASWSFQLLSRLVYRLGPGSLLFRILSTLALQLFGSNREVSGVLLAIGHGERSLQVRWLPFQSLYSLLILLPQALYPFSLLFLQSSVLAAILMRLLHMSRSS